MQSSYIAGFLVLVFIVGCRGQYIGRITTKANYSSYHLPWACVVVHCWDITVSTPISSCAIFDENKVFAAASNFNKDFVSADSEKLKYFQDVRQYGKLYVNVGSNVLAPQRYHPYGAPRYQTRRVIKMYISTKRQVDQNGQVQWSYKSDPFNANDFSKDSMEYDVYGPAFNIAILVVDKNFLFDEEVRPIPIPRSGDLQQKTNDFIEGLGIFPCIIYTWHNASNLIRYHHAMLIPREDCLNLYCMWDVAKCDLFPKQSYQVCFKTATYVDACQGNQGGAVYCPSFDQSVFAFLTTALSCGQRNLPGVYTTLPDVISLYETVFKTKFDKYSRPYYEPLGLVQHYSKYG